MPREIISETLTIYSEDNRNLVYKVVQPDGRLRYFRRREDAQEFVDYLDKKEKQDAISKRRESQD